MKCMYTTVIISTGPAKIPKGNDWLFFQHFRLVFREYLKLPLILVLLRISASLAHLWLRLRGKYSDFSRSLHSRRRHMHWNGVLFYLLRPQFVHFQGISIRWHGTNAHNMYYPWYIIIPQSTCFNVRQRYLGTVLYIDLFWCWSLFLLLYPW